MRIRSFIASAALVLVPSVVLAAPPPKPAPAKPAAAPAAGPGAVAAPIQAPAPPPPAPPAPPPPPLPNRVISDQELEGLASSTNIDEIFKYYREPKTRKSGAPVFKATGSPAADIVAETAQILGQIVVDRATQAAYQEISINIQEGLGCAANSEKVDEDEKRAVTVKLPATCQVLKTLRIQEIAMAREALLKALMSDMTDLVAKKYKLDDSKTKFVQLAADATARSILAVLFDSRRTQHVQVANALVDELVSLASTYIPEGQTDAYQKLQKVDRPAILAVGALLRCLANSEPEASLASCPISLYVDQIAQELDKKPSAVQLTADDHADVRMSARIIARGLLTALTAETAGKDFSKNPPAVRERLHGATTALFESACFSLAGKPEACIPTFDYDKTYSQTKVEALATVRGMLDAGIDEDTNRMLSILSVGVLRIARWEYDQSIASPRPKYKPEQLSRPQQRALRLVGGIVQYAETYAVKSDASEKELHAQRTKILESVTADITDRTGREGDVIFSFGGSLGAVGGARIPLGKGAVVPATPFSLSLGLAMHTVARGSSPGLHLELGVVDLAQYVSFQGDSTADKAIVVAKPDPLAMIAPSFKLGMQWKTQIPLFLAAGVSYSPLFKTGDETAPQKGSLTVGLNLGAYVPLWDIN